MRCLTIPRVLAFLVLSTTPAVLGEGASPAGLAGAGAPRWQQIGPDGPAVVLSLAFDPQRPRVAFAGMAGGGIARSEDAGLTWRTSSEGLTDPYVSGLIVHPRLSRLVYATGGGRLLRSLDGGRSWSELQVPGTRLGGFAPAFAPAPTDPALVYAGTEAGLFVSRNSGDSWRRVEGGGLPPFYGVAAVAVDAKDPRLLYAGIRDYRGFGLWVTEDSGLTWLRRLHAVPEQLLADPQRSGTVYLLKFGIWQRSRDRGATWDAYFNPSAVGGGRALGLVFDPRHAWIAYVLSYTDLYVQNSAALYKTTDDGAHWQALTAGLPTSLVANALAASVAGTLLFSSDLIGGFYRSADGGESWATAGSGLINTGVAALAFGAPGTLFASTGLGISRTRDGGATWSQVLQQRGVAALAVDRLHPETVYAGTYLASGIDPHIVWKTTDGGDSWAPLPYPQAAADPLSGIHAVDLAVDPTDSRLIYLATQAALVGPGADGQGVYRSPDGGQTWIKTGLPAVDFLGLAVDPRQPGTVWAIWFYGVYKSTDFGQSWNQVLASALGRPLRAIALAPSAPNVVWIIGDYATHGSADGGMTWQTLPGLVSPPYFAFELGPTHALAVDPADPEALYVAWTRGVSRLSRGSGWQDFDAGLLNREALTVAFDPADPAHLVAGTGGAGAFELRFAPPP